MLGLLEFIEDVTFFIIEGIFDILFTVFFFL